MADEKISQLPAVTTVATSDLAVAVASGTTSKITQQQLINALVSFITANVNINGGEIVLGTDGSGLFGSGNIELHPDGSAGFAGGAVEIGANATLIIQTAGGIVEVTSGGSLFLTSGSSHPVELGADGTINVTSASGSEPIINLTDSMSGNCYIMCNLDGSGANSVLFGIDPSGCFFQYGSNFNQFQIQQGGGGLGTIALGLLAISQGGSSCGTATLNGLTPVVVACPFIADDSLVFLTNNSPGGTPGVPIEISASRIDGTSFSIRSTNALDSSIVAWMVVPNADTL